MRRATTRQHGLLLMGALLAVSSVASCAGWPCPGPAAIMAEREEARRRAAAQQAGGAPVAQGQPAPPAARPPTLAPPR